MVEWLRRASPPSKPCPSYEPTNHPWWLCTPPHTRSCNPAWLLQEVGAAGHCSVSWLKHNYWAGRERSIEACESSRPRLHGLFGREIWKDPELEWVDHHAVKRWVKGYSALAGRTWCRGLLAGEEECWRLSQILSRTRGGRYLFVFIVWISFLWNFETTYMQKFYSPVLFLCWVDI